MKACAYVRVARTEQERGGSVELVRRLMEEKAAEQEVPILQWYVDEGIDGLVPFAVRPEGAKLLEDLDRGLFDTVVVLRLDRLGRSKQSCEAALASINQRGVAVRSLAEPMNGASVLAPQDGEAQRMADGLRSAMLLRLSE